MPAPPIVQAGLVIPSRPEHLPEVRELVGSTADKAGFPPHEVQRIVTAAFEAVVNAATHGSPLAPQNTINVTVSVYADRMVVEVADQGPGFGNANAHEMPDLASARGRGIALMRALVDEVELVTDGGGKVILTKYRRVE